MRIGVDEYTAALRDVMAFMPPGDASDETLAMAREALDIDLVEMVDMFRDMAFLEISPMLPLFSALLDRPSEATVDAVTHWLAGVRLVTLAAGVRAGRLYPETPFDEAVRSLR